MEDIIYIYIIIFIRDFCNISNKDKVNTIQRLFHLKIGNFHSDTRTLRHSDTRTLRHSDIGVFVWVTKSCRWCSNPMVSMGKRRLRQRVCSTPRPHIGVLQCVDVRVCVHIQLA